MPLLMQTHAFSSSFLSGVKSRIQGSNVLPVNFAVYLYDSNTQTPTSLLAIQILLVAVLARVGWLRYSLDCLMPVSLIWTIMHSLHWITLPLRMIIHLVHHGMRRQRTDTRRRFVKLLPPPPPTKDLSSKVSLFVKKLRSTPPNYLLQLERTP